MTTKKFIITFETTADFTPSDLNFLLTTILNTYCARHEPLDDYVATHYSEHTEECRRHKMESLRRLVRGAHDLNRTKEIFDQ